MRQTFKLRFEIESTLPATGIVEIVEIDGQRLDPPFLLFGQVETRPSNPLKAPWKMAGEFYAQGDLGSAAFKLDILPVITSPPTTAKIHLEDPPDPPDPSDQDPLQ